MANQNIKDITNTNKSIIGGYREIYELLYSEYRAGPDIDLGFFDTHLNLGLTTINKYLHALRKNIANFTNEKIFANLLYVFIKIIWFLEKEISIMIKPGSQTPKIDTVRTRIQTMLMELLKKYGVYLSSAPDVNKLCVELVSVMAKIENQHTYGSVVSLVLVKFVVGFCSNLKNVIISTNFPPKTKAKLSFELTKVLTKFVGTDIKDLPKFSFGNVLQYMIPSEFVIGELMSLEELINFIKGGIKKGPQAELGNLKTAEIKAEIKKVIGVLENMAQKLGINLIIINMYSGGVESAQIHKGSPENKNIVSLDKVSYDPIPGAKKIYLLGPENNGKNMLLTMCSVSGEIKFSVLSDHNGNVVFDNENTPNLDRILTMYNGPRTSFETFFVLRRGTNIMVNKTNEMTINIINTLERYKDLKPIVETGFIHVRPSEFINILLKLLPDVKFNQRKEIKEMEDMFDVLMETKNRRYTVLEYVINKIISGEYGLIPGDTVTNLITKIGEMGALKK